MADDSDIALIAEQMAELTRVVQGMEKRLQHLLDATASALTRADVQQERIDLAARELADVSERLQAAADALRASV